MTQLGLKNILFGLFLTMIFISCKENDDVPPILTLNGADSLDHILNAFYLDESAEAFDETDGDITENIYVNNEVDENLLGDYLVTYHAVDNAGNEATPVSRYVHVINSAGPYIAWYAAEETQVFPNQENCTYTTYVWVDSTVNYRIEFNNFACDSGLVVYADVADTLILMPYQSIIDSVRNFTLQGSGTINDSLIQLEYKKTTDSVTSYWNAKFIRL